MTHAPDPFLTAYLDTLFYAAYMTRTCAMTQEMSREQISDLWEALHNVPDLLKDWPRCNEPMLRAALKPFDDKWSKHPPHMRLCDRFHATLADPTRAKHSLRHPPRREGLEIAAAGNVVVPAYLALVWRGYSVTQTAAGGAFVAEGPLGRFTADDTISLLGVVALAETRGARWPATDAQVEEFFAKFP